MSSAQFPVSSSTLSDKATATESASAVSIQSAGPPAEDSNIPPSEPLPSQDNGAAQVEEHMLPDVPYPQTDLRNCSRAASVQNGHFSAFEFWESSEYDLDGDYPCSLDTFPWLSDLEVSEAALHGVSNMSFYSPFFNLRRWESPSGSVLGPALGPIEPSSVPSGGENRSNFLDIRQVDMDNEGSVISDTLRSDINDFMAATSLSDEEVRSFAAYYCSLWTSFIRQIGPFLTPFGARADNPFLKHLVPNAERSSSLLIAVLYLTQIIIGRQRKKPPSPEHVLLEDKANEVLHSLDEFAPCNQLRRDNPRVPAEQNSQNLLLTLSIILVFCMAFIANQDIDKLIPNIEYAVILCQALFKSQADDEGFLYLAKLLGFIQNRLLFTKGVNTINAPDYLSAALKVVSTGLARMETVQFCCTHMCAFET